MAQGEIAYIDVGGCSIAYRLRAGNVPTLVFLPGYASDMEGAKALALDAFAQERGQAMLRLDYSGTGASGGRFEDGTLAIWLEECLAAIDRLTTGPLVLVGSSMGGWLALHLALLRPERVRALVGIAAAPDFTEDLIWRDLPPDAQMMLETDGVIYERSEYDDKPYPITMDLIHEAREHLRLRGEIAFDRPVRLLHGMLDDDVPWKRSLLLAEKLRSPDVRVTLVKDGGHRLSREEDLALLTRTVGELLTV